jgi:hypothetical protein
VSDRTGTFTYRLSCTHLVSFYLPPKIGVEVLCQECRKTVQVAHRYPSLSSTCGAMFMQSRGIEGVDYEGGPPSVLLRCTLIKKHIAFQVTEHHDEPLERRFTVKSRLRSSSEGNVGKA